MMEHTMGRVSQQQQFSQSGSSWYPTYQMQPIPLNMQHPSAFPWIGVQLVPMPIVAAAGHCAPNPSLGHQGIYPMHPGHIQCVPYNGHVPPIPTTSIKTNKGDSADSTEWQHTSKLDIPHDLPNLRSVRAHCDKESESPTRLRDRTRTSVTSPSVQKRHNFSKSTHDSASTSAHKQHDATACSSKSILNCPFCEKTFTQLTNLRIHERTHTGERPFKCPSCEKCFTQKANLRVHLRTHSGERPYVCKDCDKAFVQAVHLRRHARMHAEGNIKKFRNRRTKDVVMKEKQEKLRAKEKKVARVTGRTS